jgi:hypothetical protein
MRTRWGMPAPFLLAPESPTAAESWRAARLPAPHALCARDNHNEIRDYFVSRMIEFGWRSGVEDYSKGK